MAMELKVGDLAEARSFQTGFRGAWFRCRIIKIQKGGKELQYHLEYYDFPGEKDKWIRLYQLPPYCLGKRKTRERELMVRPRYPNILNQNEIPFDDGISEQAVVIDYSWQVGDLVDWWTTGCWWSGTILQLLDGGKAQIELKPPPLGEGETYEILLKDVRPSLNWDPEHGWMLPTQDGDTNRLCPRLIGCINPVEDCGSAVKETETSGGSSVKQSLSFQPSSTSEQKSSEMQKHSTEKTASDEVMNTGIQEKITRADSGNNNSRKRSIKSDTNSGQSRASVFKDQGSSSLLKSLGPGPGKTLHSRLSDSAEAAVLDLEGVLNKVKLLKAILLQGTSQSNTPVFQWEFYDKSGASSHPNNSE